MPRDGQQTLYGGFESPVGKVDRSRCRFRPATKTVTATVS
jgi:hypothetical protein